MCTFQLILRHLLAVLSLSGCVEQILGFRKASDRSVRQDCSLHIDWLWAQHRSNGHAGPPPFLSGGRLHVRVYTLVFPKGPVAFRHRARTSVRSSALEILRTGVREIA